MQIYFQKYLTGVKNFIYKTDEHKFSSQNEVKEVLNNFGFIKSKNVKSRIQSGNIEKESDKIHLDDNDRYLASTFLFLKKKLSEQAREERIASRSLEKNMGGHKIFGGRKIR